MSTGWLIALALLAAYVAFVVWLVATGRMQKWNLSLMLGFALMVRTQHGKATIEAVARPRRFWNAFGDVSTVVTLTGMALMTVLFLLIAWIAIQPDSVVEPLAANEILVIPGVNPFVPLWYGLIGLVITLVVHEGGHGILARANGLRVKSLGLLVAVVPIGAFVEPDEDDLKAAPRRRRLRVFSAGPGVNLAVCAVFLLALALLAGAVAPRDGVHVALTVKDAPADAAGLDPGDIIEAATLLRTSGDGAGLGQTVAMQDWQAFQSYMDARRPGDEVRFDVRAPDGDGRAVVATLGSRWDSYPPEAQEELTRTDPDRAEQSKREAFLGIRPLLPENTAFLSNPVGSLVAFGQVVSLPVGEVRGQPMLSVYLPAFYETPFDADVFWVLFALAFWVFWLNLMVGLTNILPMLPLDGGHIFRDAAGAVVERLRPGMDPQRRDRLVGRTAGAMSLLILGAFVLQIVGPRLVQSLS